MVLDGIAFAAPAGLEDRSSYVHRAEAPREELSVELELPVGAATPATEVLADQRESMEGFLDAAFGVEAEGDTVLAGAPARFMRYFIVDDGERKYGKTVVGNPLQPATREQGGTGDYVRINWKGELDGTTAGSRLGASPSSSPGAMVDGCVDPIVASFRAAVELEPPPAAGLRTHYAGPWAYELPERFSAPRTRIWTDGASLRVQLTVPPINAAPLDLDGLIADQLDPGHTTLSRDDRELGSLGAARAGTRAHLRRRGSLDREWSAYVALLRLDTETGGREVAIVATAPWSDDARLEPIIQALIASVTLEEVRP